MPSTPRVIYVLLSASLMSACSDEGGQTSGFVPTHVSRVTGRVVSPSGAPLDSVMIAVNAGRTGFGYSSPRPVTNANGEFTYLVERMVAPPSIPQPDTVHAQIMVASTRPRDAVNGQAPVSTSVGILTFVPHGQTPTTTVVEVVLSR